MAPLEIYGLSLFVLLVGLCLKIWNDSRLLLCQNEKIKSLEKEKTNRIAQEEEIIAKEEADGLAKEEADKLTQEDAEKLAKKQYQITEIVADEDVTNYDVVFGFRSLSVLLEHGWKVSFPSNKKGVKEHLLHEIVSKRDKIHAVIPDEVMEEFSKIEFKHVNRKVVSVVGHYGKGKTYVMNGLYQVNVPSGKLVSTEGISVVYLGEMGDHLDGKQQYVLLDTEGSYSPISSQEPKDIVFTKASEMFLQDMVFSVSDFFIVVVNDLTWPDQEFINSLRNKIKIHGSELTKKMPNIFVVHNMKDATTKAEIDALRVKQIKEIFSGQDNGTRDNGQIFYASEQDGVSISHFILGSGNHPETREINHTTFQMMFTKLGNMTNVQEFNVCQKISNYCAVAIPNFFYGELSTSWEITNDKEILFRFDQEKEEKEKNCELKYHFEFNNSGFGINMFQSGFPLHADVVKDGDNYAIVGDLPGVSDPNSVTVEMRKNLVVISGERTKPNEIEATSEERQMMGGMAKHLKQRRNGSYFISVPLEYGIGVQKSDKKYVVKLENGVMTIPLQKLDI